MSTESKMSSWVAYPENHPFPIQNLPYGVFVRVEGGEKHIGVAIGDSVLDLAVLASKGFFASTDASVAKAFVQPALNDFMALGRPLWKAARAIITELLSAECATLRDDAKLRAECLVAQSAVSMCMPAQIGDYTDFYCSRYHATNLGLMFRGPETALKPNWLHLPVGYHGRASSVVISGTDLQRPCGQKVSNDTFPNGPPFFDECKLMDFELEMAFFVGPGNKLGEPIACEDAEDNIFGFVVMNDWSARDIQKWEYIPLGPFGGKNFGTSISPWVVTLEALEPFRAEPIKQDDPPILPYLVDKKWTCFDIKLDVAIQSETMPEPQVVSTTNARNLYWSFAQQLTQHSVTGCNMRPGDLVGSGTISGPTEKEYGSMIEICWKGTRELKMTDGTTRKFLKDGDTVIMSGHAQGDGYRIGFGSVVGKVLPSRISKQ